MTPEEKIIEWVLRDESSYTITTQAMMAYAELEKAKAIDRLSEKIVEAMYLFKDKT